MDFIFAVANARADLYKIPKMHDRTQIAGILIEIEQNLKEKREKMFQGELRLPAEIWNCIFSKLSVMDLKNVTMVCNRFNLIVAESLQSMEKICIKVTRETDPLVFCQTMAKSNRKYQNVEFEHVDFESPSNELVPNDWYLHSLRNRPIVELKISRCSLSVKRFVIINLIVQRTLRKYHIANSAIYKTNLEDIQEIIVLAKNLKWNKLNCLLLIDCNVNYDQLLQYLPRNIVTLHLSAQVEEMDHLVSFINQQTKLKTIYCSYLGRDEDTSLQITTKIDSIEFDHVHIVDASDLLWNQHQHLKELTLIHDWLDAYDYDTLAELISRMESLKKLSICYSQLPESNSPIIFYCPTLISLEYSVSGSSYVNVDVLLAAILNGTPNLREMKISGIDVLPRISENHQLLQRLQINNDGQLIRFADELMSAIKVIEIYCRVNSSVFQHTHILKKLPNLQSIIIRGELNKFDFKAIMTETSNLKNLLIENGSYLPGNILREHQTTLKSLAILHISSFGQQSKESQIMLAEHPTLKSYIKLSQ